MNEVNKKLFDEKIDRIHDKVEETLKHIKWTNGRVAEVRDDVNYLQQWKAFMNGAITVLTFMLTLIAGVLTYGAFS